MARLIDADTMKEELLWGNVYLSDNETNALVDLIDNQPTIDLESLRPRGHWEKETVDGPDVVKYTSLLSVFCSRCRRRAWMKSTYCPHCGSFMENKNGENLEVLYETYR